MDRIWLEAPSPALKLGANGSEAGWQLNPAAQQWACVRGWHDADWAGVCRDIRDQLARATNGQVHRAGATVRWQAVDVNAGVWLVWLTPQATAAPAKTGFWGSDTDKLDLVQDFGQMGLFERDLRSGEGRWDAHLFRLFGLDPADGAPALDQGLQRVHPDDREHFRSEHLRISDLPGRHSVHYRLVLPDGTNRDVKTMVEIRHDAAGRPAMMFGVIADNTESAQRVREQKVVSAQLARALDLAQVSVWRIDLADQRIYFNDVGYELTGVAPRADGLSLDEVRAAAHPDDRLAVQMAAEAAMRSDRVVDLEARYAMPGGGYRHLTTRRVAERDEHGRVVGLLGISLDQTASISERARAQALSRRIEVVAEAAELGIFSVDLDSGLVEWNAQMLRIHGLAPGTPAPTVREWFDRLVHAEDRAAVRAAQWQATAPGVAGSEVQYRICRPDGTIRWVMCRARQEQIDGRRVLVGVHLDATALIEEQQRAEQAMREKLAAERSSQAKSEFLARVSHELRTPLNAVLGFAQLIEHDGVRGVPEVQQERVTHIRAAGEHLRALIDDVLDLAAIEAGTLPLLIGTVALADVLADVVQWAGVQAQLGEVSLHVEASAGRVRADARRLRQILVNLLSNAVKYNRRGGHVWLGACALKTASGAGWQISVRDDGRGLNALQREHLFESFNRLGAEREGIEGVGMGLVIVRQLTELMGGEVTVVSERGQGSDFRVWLPAAEASAAAIAPVASLAARPPPADPGALLSVLYIEDNTVNVLLVQQLVSMRPGVTLVCATDGASGVDRAVADHPDVVLIDMQLPDIDGFEVLRRLRADPVMATRPLIALSANGMTDDIAAAREAGFDDYWTKPIDLRQFLSGLDALAANVRA